MPSICVTCNSPLTDDSELCYHHHTSYMGDQWALSNKIICDYIHRGIEPQPIYAPNEEFTPWQD